MKYLVLASLLGFVTACSSPQSFTSASSEKAAATASSSTGSSTATITGSAAPKPTSSQVGAITSAIGTMAGNAFVGVQVSSNGGVQSFNKTFSCTSGGTASISAQASLSLSVGYPSTTASMSGGEATITFTNCQLSADGSTFTVNGSASLASAQGQGSVNETSGAFSAQGSDQISGSLQLTSDSSTSQCTLTLSNTNSATGTITLSTSLSGTATVAASLTGTACSLTVDESYNSTVQL